MKFKLVLIFVLSILIPTFLLAYFGFQAVKSEKAIIQENMLRKYKAMADIVTTEVTKALDNAPQEQLQDSKGWEDLILQEAALFQGDVEVFDAKGRPVEQGSPRRLQDAVYAKPLATLPYTIAVYERYPLVFQVLEEKHKKVALYVSMIIFAAVSILAGGFYAVWSLSREWRFAELKSEFVSHLSHDLRRPLTSIRMFAEMLENNHVPDEAKRREYYKIISTESTKLTHLANNILDFSRIEQGRIKYNFREEDLAGLVRGTVDRFRIYLADEAPRDVTLDIEDETSLPAVKIDANAIGQAVMNLLTNAAKYSSPGTPVSVRLARRSNDVVIEVQDHGPGIPVAEQEKIFGKYYRASGVHVAQVEGSGLGLTLVKYTVEAHKGRVKLESEEGKGSTFTIVLPC